MIASRDSGSSFDHVEQRESSSISFCWTRFLPLASLPQSMQLAIVSTSLEVKGFLMNWGLWMYVETKSLRSSIVSNEKSRCKRFVTGTSYVRTTCACVCVFHVRIYVFTQSAAEAYVVIVCLFIFVYVQVLRSDLSHLQDYYTTDVGKSQILTGIGVSWYEEEGIRG